MKAVIIGQQLNKNWSNKISGGIQTVERLHVKLLKELGYEIFFIASSDSEAFSDECTFININSPSQEACGDMTRAEKAALSRKSAAEIQDEILTINPDLIINHSFSSSHVRIAAELSKKFSVMCFVHNTPDTAMDIGVIAKVQHYKTLTNNGGALVCVSEYQRDLWRKTLRKRLLVPNGSFQFLDESMIDRIYNHVVYPVYMLPQTAVEQKGHYIVISRPDPIKAVDKLLSLALECQIKFPIRVYLAHPTDLELNEFFVKKIQPSLKQMEIEGWDVKLHHNAPRQQLLDDLSTAVGCFIPCPVEASPVAFLEAGSYGVTSIVFAKEKDGVADHAAFHMLQHSLDVNISQKDAAMQLATQVMALQQIGRGINWRNTMAEETELRHSFTNRIEELKIVINSISKKKSQTILEF